MSIVGTTGALPNLRRLHEWNVSGGDKLAVEAFDLRWDEILRPQISGTVLHIGSKASVLDNSARWREFLPHCRVIGMDVSPGENVDVVCDIQAPVQEIRRKCDARMFDAIVCVHVLEHVSTPWVAARNMQFLLKPGGCMVLTVPWVQGYHGFPDDHWRMSFSGLRSLFPEVVPELEFYSGAAEETGYRLLMNDRPEFTERTCRIERNLFQIMLEEAPQQEMFADEPGSKLPLSRLYMPACSVNSIGRRKG